MLEQDKIKDLFKQVMKSGIRMRQRRPDRFDRNTLKTITLSLEGGVLAVTGRLKGQKDRKIQTLIFNKSINEFCVKAWNLKQAKMWVKTCKDSVRKIVNPEKIINKLLVTKMIKSMEKTLIQRLPKAIEKTLEANR